MAYRLLFVCLGNICRSPSGENIMNQLLNARGLESQVICDSAGTSGYHIDAKPDRRMNAAAERKFRQHRTIPISRPRRAAPPSWRQ